jgi:Flp pilus assembly protein TadD/pSer/pThr/pTyr-binding forkhead associated (FHA) protein
MVGAETTSSRARLQFVSGNGSGRAFDLTQERVNIGRDDSNVICIKDDTISSHHALLIRSGDHFKLRDLISTNGTYLNGERTMDAVLRHGDVLRFGKVELRYEEVEGVTPVQRTESPQTVLPLGRSRPVPSTPAHGRQFRIVGSDGRTYGPADAPTVRKWIQQGFANAQTYVPAESRGNWKRLSDFPEFADALAGNEIPTNLLGTPPKEALWTEPVKVGPSAEPDAMVTFPEEARTAKALGAPRKRKRRGASVFVGAVLLIAVGGGVAAWWFDQWPFDMRGPLRRYARGADGYIYADPDFVAAEMAEDTKDYAGLLKNAKQLVNDYPDSSLAHYILGVAYGKMRFFGDATASFQRSIKLKPDYVDAWNNLGWAYTESGKFSEAVSVFEQLIKFTPKDAQVWSNLGGAQARLGHEADAISAYQMAIQLKPDYADAHFNLGVAYASQARFEDAVKSFRLAIKYQPNFAEAWFNLGVVFNRQGSNDEAAIFFQQAVKFRPDYAEAWGGLVKTYLAMHESEKAGEAAREMKRIDPAKAEQLADELSREEPKPVAEAPPSDAPQVDPPAAAVAQPQPTDAVPSKSE